MKSVGLFVFGIVLAALLLFIGHAWSAEYMRECADGTFTNKGTKGCSIIFLPELSIVPDRHAVVVPEAPITVVEPPVAIVPQVGKFQAGAPGVVLSTTCALYKEYMELIEKKQSGRNYTVVELQRQAMLTASIPPGFSPYGCQ